MDHFALNKAQQTRKDKLIKELSKYGLELRDDSVVCRSYILSGNKALYKFDRVIEIMREMDFLYKHTNYAKILNELYRDEDYFHKEEILHDAKKFACVEFCETNSVDLLPPSFRYFIKKK